MPTKKPQQELTEFDYIIREIVDLERIKRADYGSDADPLSNIRGAEDFNVPAWVGAAIRANDKMRRIQAVARGQNLKNESVEDSMLDLAVYAIHMLTLYREAN